MDIRRSSLSTRLVWAKYEVVLAVEEPLLLPVFKGATLRGSFGQTLKRLCCAHDASTCEVRPPACRCPYGFLFSPVAPEGRPDLRTGEEIARPFVIEPPPDGRLQYQPGETLTFHLLLFGRAGDHLPYFLVTFRELPPIGIPPHRGRVALREVWAVEDVSGVKRRVTSSADGIVQSVDLTMSSEALEAAAARFPTDRLTLDFQTNTILRYLGNKEGVRRIEFHILISRLLQRVEALAALYGDAPPPAEGGSDAARGLIQSAKAVTIVHDETRWNLWSRHSTRQEQKVPMDGVVGRVTYAGDLAPFIPLLLLGQYTHVGKGCVFGLGKYEVKGPTP